MWLKWMRVYLDSRCVSCAVRSEWIRNPPLTQESDADARNNEAMWDVTPFGSPSETNGIASVSIPWPPESRVATVATTDTTGLEASARCP